MQWNVPEAALAALSAPVFQLAITVGVGVLCAYLWWRFGKLHFGWWALAWALYALRLGAIVTFLGTERPIWLFWHQVATGWTAVGLLWAALVFARRSRPALPYIVAGVAFPLLWSWVAIYRLDDFLLAAGPAVAFLSGATLWTGAVFFRHYRRGGSGAALLLASTFALWAAHHLDYPFLRGQGIWNPWGYYIDIVLTLVTACGLLLLVQDDLRVGIETLSDLSGELQRAATPDGLLQELMERVLSLRGVVGAALYRQRERGGAYEFRAGEARGWPQSGTDADFEAAAALALARGQVQRYTLRPRGEGSATERFLTLVPLAADGGVDRVLIVAADARDPFTALDDRFLQALGRQIEAALERADLHARLAERSSQLQALAVQMTRQHEQERHRLSRDLHDETAQVLAALHLELGSLRDELDGEAAEGMDTALRLAGEGIRSIREVTHWLRPPLLDDLGLLPALEALIDDYRSTGGFAIEADLPGRLPESTRDTELTVYRALQEGLANAARHARTDRVEVALRIEDDALVLSVRDHGRGLPAEGVTGGTGIAGLRERLHGIGGAVALTAVPEGGVLLLVRAPLSAQLAEAEE